MKKRFIMLGMVLIAILAGCSRIDNKKEETKMTETAITESATSPIAEVENTQEQTIATEQPIESVKKTKVYVSTEWVNSVIQGQQPQSQNYIIIEASWGKADKEYLMRHVPGAIHMNTDLVEEDTHWNIRTPEEIEMLMKDYGITKDTTVIVYGKDSGAERVAFVMLWAGVEEVHMLDGGLAAWERGGFETESGEIKPIATGQEFGTEIPAHPEYVLSMPEEVIEAQKDPAFRLVSIRSWEEFTGQVSGYSYIERKGEPAGAVWGYDEFDYYDENRMVKRLDEIQKDLWEEWDITKDNEISFYCGTGWRASIPFLICYENGWDNMTLYDGGWYVWQMDDSLPVQTGDPREQ